jgi:potassium-transporting ATPase KdpC subunit
MRQLLAAARVLLVLTVVLGVLYPLVVTGIAQVTMPSQADGSLLRVDGEILGSVLLGQEFAGPEWFHGRPDEFDPAASGPTNLGPSSEYLTRFVGVAVARLRSTEAWGGPVPADAVTGSGSGLDPHISPDYARLQVRRVAAARHLGESDVLALVQGLIEGRTLSFLGEPRVNVLKLNMALSRLQP